MAGLVTNPQISGHQMTSIPTPEQSSKDHPKKPFISSNMAALCYVYDVYDVYFILFYYYQPSITPKHLGDISPKRHAGERLGHAQRTQVGTASIGEELGVGH